MTFRDPAFLIKWGSTNSRILCPSPERDPRRPPRSRPALCRNPGQTTGTTAKERTSHMTNQLHEKSTASALAEIQALFGPPPVLSSESPSAYDAMLEQLLQ